MKKPNIIYIMSDDHAANAISAYGSRLVEVFETPNIDRIAKEGCLLQNCHCQNAICTPSRATILTGQYSHTNGVRTLEDVLDQAMITFPKIMQEDGYQTALFGKWHVHSPPEGFDTYKILPGQGLYHNPVFLESEKEWDKSIMQSGWGDHPQGTKHEGYVTDLTTDFCIEWLDSIDKEKPFLLLCHHKAPHDNFEYHPRHEHLFDGMEIPEPDSLWEDKAHRSDGSRDYGTTVSDRNLHRNAIKTMSEPQYCTGQLDITGLNAKQRTKVAYQKYLKDYLRTVKCIDENVGRLLDWLDENNLAENTLVIYTSDQGMFLGEHDYIDKRWIYDEALRMPFVVRWPGVIQPGTVMDTVVSNVDFCQTLLESTGLEATSAMQGRSFLEVLKGSEPEDWPNVAYNRYWMHMTHHDNPAHYGIRTKDYMMVYFYGLPLDATGAEDYKTPEGWELYDLKKDPFEVNNVYGDPAYRDVVRELKTKLKRIKDDIGDEDTRYPEMMALSQRLY